MVRKAFIFQLIGMLQFKYSDSVPRGFKTLNNVFFYVYRKDRDNLFRVLDWHNTECLAGLLLNRSQYETNEKAICLHYRSQLNRRSVVNSPVPVAARSKA